MQIVEQEVNGAAWDPGDAFHVERETHLGESLERQALLDAAAHGGDSVREVPGDEVDAVVGQILPEFGAERAQVEQIAAFRAGWRESFRRLDRDEKRREGYAGLGLGLGLGDRREQAQRREQGQPIDHGDLRWFGRRRH